MSVRVTSGSWKMTVLSGESKSIKSGSVGVSEAVLEAEGLWTDGS